MAARWALLAVFVVGCRCWKLPVVPADRRAQFYTQQSDGAYKYGFDTAQGTYQLQHGDTVNEVHGQYGADGGRTEYTAGVGGFQIVSQTQPTSDSRRSYESTREATLEELTRPVTDTAAVAAAKAKFQREYERAAAAAAAAPDINIITGAVPVIVEHPQRDPAYDDVRYDGPLAVIGPDGGPEETDEVKAAKAQVLALQEAAAQATLNAPERDIITGAVPVIVEAPVVQDNGLRYSGPLATLDAEGNVQETAEVKAAKAQILAAQEAAAQAALNAPDRDIITGAVPVIVEAPVVQDDGLRYSGPFATLDAEGHVQETAEVKAAKAQILAAQEAAAQAALNAPDRDVITGAVPVIVEAPVVQDDGLRYSGPLATLDAEGNVQETAEVKAVKAALQAAHSSAAAAAASAPDINIIRAASSAAAQAGSGHHGVTRQYKVSGVTVQEADGASSPAKYGYAYE